MAITRGNYVNSPIPNTTMQEVLRDGLLYMYELSPVSGYLIHDKSSDTVLEDVEMYNEETGEFEIVNKTLLGFIGGTTSCLANYDFTTNPREFYTILREDAPPDAVIFGGGGNNNHEI